MRVAVQALMQTTAGQERRGQRAMLLTALPWMLQTSCRTEAMTEARVQGSRPEAAVTMVALVEAMWSSERLGPAQRQHVAVQHTRTKRRNTSPLICSGLAMCAVVHKALCAMLDSCMRREDMSHTWTTAPMGKACHQSEQPRRQ